MITVTYETEFSMHSFTELWKKYNERGFNWITSRMPERHTPKIQAYIASKDIFDLNDPKLLLPNPIPDNDEFVINYYLTNDPFPVPVPEGYRVIRELT